MGKIFLFPQKRPILRLKLIYKTEKNGKKYNYVKAQTTVHGQLGLQINEYFWTFYYSNIH
jgi:hypothetical protein